MWQAGQKLGRFTLDKEIGQGSHGVVWLATDTALSAQVAIKILHPWLTEDVPVRDRFKRELLLARRIAHPGICRLFDLHEEAGSFFITMDYVEGETLLNILKREGRLQPMRATKILRGVCNALAAAHAAGVIHRDLKPANIIVRAGDDPMILDFGTATAGDVSRVTRPGTAVGSMRFIAPEIFTGTAPSISTDLYSLGVVAYVTIAGRLPYNAAAGAIEMLEMIRSQAPMRLDALEPDVPARLADVVARAMHREPAQRFASAQAFAEGLAEVETEIGRTEVNKSPPTTGDFAKWAPSALIRESVSPEVAGKPVSPENSTSDVRPSMRPSGDAKPPTSLVTGASAGPSLPELPEGKTEASIANPFLSAVSPATINEKPPHLSLPEPPVNLEKTTVTAPPPIPPSASSDTVVAAMPQPPDGAVGDREGPATLPLPGLPSSGAIPLPNNDVTVVSRAPDMPLKVARFDPDLDAGVGRGGPGIDKRLIAAAAAAVVAIIAVIAIATGGDDDETVASADGGTGAPLIASESDAGADVVAVVDGADAGSGSGSGAAPSDVVDAGEDNTLVFEEPAEDDDVDAGPSNGAVRPPRPKNPIDGEVKQARLLMLKRGFWPGDLPAAEQALVKAKSAGRAGKNGEANKLVDQARTAIEKQQIDRAFVLAKLTRFNKKFDKSRRPDIANKVEPLARDAGQSFGAGDFDTANKKLNRAFALIGNK